MTEKLFHSRWTELGLAETAALVPVDATITPLTLAELRQTLVAPKARDEITTLPRISLDTSAVQPSGAARPGADLTIREQLGEGGMGRVFLVRQHSLARDVALKTLKDNVSAAAKDALLCEARVTGALDHPGVIPVHALGLDEQGRPLLVMKRVEGVEWRTLLQEPDHSLWSKRGTHGLEGNLEILMRVCQTLEFSHSRGMLHLDIKPENVMVGAFGEVYLVDWGIAAPLDGRGADSKRVLVGTPAYMAPEMVLGGPLDERTDVYLLGATLHEVITARPRHPGSELHAVLLHAVLSAPVVYEHDVPAELGELANRATHGDPRERPASAAELREALQEFLRRRSANALSDAALERVTELERALEGPDVDLGEAYRLVTEARFGFAQSLREKPGLVGATRGAERAVRALIELELRQGHADTARALLRELGPPDPKLVSQIEAIERKAGLERRETERLRALERDLDPGVSATARTWALGFLAVLLLVAGAIVQLTGGVAMVTPAVFVIVAAVIALIATSALFGLRRHLLTNAFNKRMAILLMLVVYVSLANRILGYVTHTPLQTMVIFDLTLVLGVLAGAAVLMPSLWISFAWILAALGVIRVFPERALLLFSLAMTTNALLLVGLFWRGAKRSGVDR